MGVASVERLIIWTGCSVSLLASSAAACTLMVENAGISATAVQVPEALGSADGQCVLRGFYMGRWSTDLDLLNIQ